MKRTEQAQLCQDKPGGLGIIASGIAAAYLEEGFEAAAPYRVQSRGHLHPRIKAAHPFPAAEARKMLAHCQTILVLEELEPLIERGVYVEAQKMGYKGKIIGKLDGVFSRIGEYGVPQVVQGLAGCAAPGDPGRSICRQRPGAEAGRRPPDHRLRRLPAPRHLYGDQQGDQQAELEEK